MARVKNSNSLAENRKARHDYFVEESMEAGIELVGTEVKSIRGGKCNLKDCYADIKNGEIFILNMHISPYEHGNIFIWFTGKDIPDNVSEITGTVKAHNEFQDVKQTVLTRCKYR